MLLSDRQVRTWVARYNADGPDALADHPGRGRKAPLSADRQERLRDRLRTGPTEADGVCTLRGGDVRRILVRSSGWSGRSRPCTPCCTGWGSSPCGPDRGTPGPTRPRRTASKKPRRSGRRGRRAHPGERVEVWFEDEARFGQKGTLTTVWAREGHPPDAPKQTAYANLHVLTAACPASGRAEGLVAPRLSTSVVQSFLDQLSATIPRRTHVVLVWDGAGYHVAKALRVPANLSVVTLPPYSPELNPVERLWLYLRSHHWSNRVYPDVDALEEAAVSGWRAVCLHPDRIKTIC